jgi:hypothetical protein
LGAIAIVLLLAIVVFALLIMISPSFRNFAANYLPFISHVSSQDTSATENQPLTLPAPIIQNVQPSQSSPQVPSQPSTSGGRLILSADKATWAQIAIDANPMQHFYFQPNQTRIFESQRTITLVAGDGQALRAEWNNKNLGVLGPEGPIELNFPLPPVAN